MRGRERGEQRDTCMRQREREIRKRNMIAYKKDGKLRVKWKKSHRSAT